MDKIVCKICNTEFDNDTRLHRHLKSHKISMVEYYQTHFPRRDKFDGNIIKFKSKEYYFSTDFNSRVNYVAWLKKVSVQESKDYFILKLKKRKEDKHLKYSPTQVELRSLNLCGITYVNEHYGDYYQICEVLGFHNRFVKYSFTRPLLDISKNKIIVDTREQAPLDLNAKVKNTSLKFGDYKLEDSRKIKSDLYIERKSVSDLYGTMTGGYERFNREILRAKEAGAYFVILVEGNFKEVNAFSDKLKWIGKGRISPEFVWHNVREILQNNNFVQFLFVENRDESSRIVKKLMSSDGQYSEVDLQHYYDTKGL